MKLALAVVLLAAAGCRKTPKYEDKTQSQAVTTDNPANASAEPPNRVQPGVDANPVQGAALIKKAEVAAEMANREVHKEEKVDVPTK
jgi:hypothetical protein